MYFCVYLFKYRARGSVDPEGRLLKRKESERKRKRNHSFAPGGLLALHSAALARRLNAYCAGSLSPLSVSYVYAEKDMLSNLVMVAERSFPEQLWDVLSPECAELRTWA